jgi:hypothetical protein
MLILLLLTVKSSIFLFDNFSQTNIEKIINTCPDEIEIEVESETAFFQKISKNNTFCLTKVISVKAPVFKNTFFQKMSLLEFSTPPPEIIS